LRQQIEHGHLLRRDGVRLAPVRAQAGERAVTFDRESDGGLEEAVVVVLGEVLDRFGAALMQADAIGMTEPLRMREQGSSDLFGA